ncbi:MAG: hypothetical protein RI897_1830 [Verrucomicrobiota bacterium]
MAAVVIGDAEGGDVHTALLEELIFREVGFFVFAGMESHAVLAEPAEGGAGFGVFDLGAFEVEGGLAESFLEDAGGVEEFVGDDGIEHAHAAFVKDAEDGFFLLELAGESFAEFGWLRGELDFIERSDVIGGVLAGAFIEPLLEVGGELGVGEVFAPESGEWDAGFGEAAVEVEHTDEAGPSAGPVSDCEDGSLVGGEAVEDVMGVLPDRFGDDEGGFGVDIAEDFETFFLGADESVFFLGFVGVGTDDLPALGFDG